MAKRPQDRYASCSELADDLRRWLNTEPIQARRVGIAERLVRWSVRNPWVAALAAAVLVSVTVGLAGVTWQWRRAESALTEATLSEMRANENAQALLVSAEAENKERIRANDNAEKERRARNQAEKNLSEARQQRELAETQLYFNQIRNAAQTLTSDASSAVRRLGEAEVARREWEWRYLWRLARANANELKFDRQQFFAPHERPTDFSPDLVRVIEDDTGRLLYVWRQDDRLGTGLVDDNEQVVPIDQTKIEGDQLAISPGGVYAAALDTSSNMLTIWPTLRPAEQVHVSRVRGTLLPWGISDDGQWFGVVLNESESQLRRVSDNLAIRIRHGKAPHFMGFSAGGDFLVSWHGRVRLYAAKLLRAEQPARMPFELLVGHDARSRRVAMDPRSKWLAAASRNKGVTLWNADTRAIEQTFSGGRRATRSLVFSHSGQRLATLDGGGTLRLWDRRSGEPLLAWNEVVSEGTTISFGPRDRTLFGFQPDGGIAKWRAELPPPEGNLHGHHELVRMIELSPDGRRLLSSSYDGTAKLWDTETEQEMLILRGHSATVDGVRFQPHGSLIASGSWDRTVRLWDADTGALLRTLIGHTDRVKGIAFHPEGKLLASIGMDGTARLWDLGSGALLRTLETGAKAAWRITFSPDGKQLAAGTSRGVAVWRTADWQEAYRINAHRGVVHCVTYSPDGRTIATCGFDKQIHLTDAATGRHLGKLGAHGDLAYSVDFSPDGRLLVSASRDKLLKYWNVEQRQLVAETRLSKGFPMVALFFPDGRRVVTAGWDTVVRILDVPTDALPP